MLQGYVQARFVTAGRRSGWLTLAGLGALLATSAFVRTRALDASYSTDEGISIGISSHGLFDIPGLLEQDGSPPLYYLLLGVWTRIAGTGEEATHALSLAFALLAVPAAFWAGRALFGPRTGWICATVAALNPFLTNYAQEARMYSLVMLLSILATAAYLRAFVWGDRRYVPVFAVTLAALLYTHNWGLFFAAGALLALLPLVARAEGRRLLLYDILAAFGAPALVYLPWLPTLLSQAEHTGAPWSERPSIGQLADGLSLSPSAGAAALTLFSLAGIGGVGALVLLLRGAPSSQRTAARTALLLLVVSLAFAWIAAQIEPSWANRYLAVLLGPALLVSGAGLARLRNLGLVVVLALGALWLGYRADKLETNVRLLSTDLGAALEPGDLVVSTQPEQVPVLFHYLPDGLRYATPLGPVPDARLMDWRDALSRLESARASEDLAPLLGGLPVGARLLLVARLGPKLDWSAPWKPLVLARSAEWADALAADARFRQLVERPPEAEARVRLRAVLYEKRDW